MEQKIVKIILLDPLPTFLDIFSSKECIIPVCLKTCPAMSAFILEQCRLAFSPLERKREVKFYTYLVIKGFLCALTDPSYLPPVPDLAGTYISARKLPLLRPSAHFISSI